MTEVVGLPAEPAGRPGATAVLAAVERWRRPPAWLWGLSVLAQVASAAALTGYTFFFVDDFLFLEQARTQPFSIGYLRESLFEHFSPISRLLDKLLVSVAPGSFVVAHVVELAMYAGALIAFAMVVCWVLGNGWGAFALTVLFGQSIFLMRLLNWWTATANILPSTIFMLLALGCYLRWRGSGSRWMLAVCFAAFALSLLDYETAILWPAYVAAISLLVLERTLSPRAWLATLWRERWAWTGFVILDGAAIVNYYANYYYPATRPTLSQILSYLEITVFQTFIPALVGIKYPADPGRHPVAIAAAAVVVCGAVAVTLYLRPRAWRCLVAFILVFALTMLPVALTRITEFGVSIGHVIYYQQSLQFMFLIFAAFALSPRWSGRRARSPSRPRSRLLALPRPSRGVLAAAGVVALAAYAALLLTSVNVMSLASWQPRQNSAYVSTYLASDRRLRRKNGSEPVLIDLKVPKQVLPTKLWPYTTYAEFFALFNPRLRIDGLAKRSYVIGRKGRLLPVRFAASTSAALEHARVSGQLGSAGARVAGATRSLVCAPTDRRASWLRLPLASPQRLRGKSNNLAYAVRVRFLIPSTSWVRVRLLARHRGLGFATVTHLWYRGRGGQLIPLEFTGRVTDLAFRVPAHACITSVQFGALRYSRGV